MDLLTLLSEQDHLSKEHLMQQTKSKTIIIALAILFSLTALLGLYSWNQNASLETSNDYLRTKVLDLSDTRDELLGDIETLEEEFEELTSENEKNKTSLEAANKTITSSKAALAKLQKKYNKDIGWMKAELKNLRAAKAELTALVEQLRREQANGNATDGALLDSRLENIEARNKELEGQLAATKARNNALESDNRVLDISAIQATNTRVDIRKKGNKPTGSFRRAREIIVSFDLNHLAATKEGVHNLFVVIKDANGNLVKVANPVKKKITSQVDGVMEEIIAQQMVTADLFEKVRLQFKVRPEKKTLKKGYYWVFIYADWGLIGRTEFELR